MYEGGGKVAKFEVIYKEYFKDVFLYCIGLTKDESLSEEITQETFFKAMNAIDKFRGTCDVRVWLCQIAKNQYFSYLRKNNLLCAYENLEKTVTTGVCIEQQMLNKDLALQIHKKIHELGEPYKEIFSLRVFGELSFQQIGEVLGKSENWACVTFHRARIKIQEKMEEE